jgi:CheY-like chemotaxis protein
MVTNGAEATSWLTANHCDFVVTDLEMPVMGGLQLLEWTQTNKPLLSTILMTGALSPKTEVADPLTPRLYSTLGPFPVRRGEKRIPCSNHVKTVRVMVCKTKHVSACLRSAVRVSGLQ